MGTAGEEYYGLSAIGLSPDGAKLAVTRLNGGSDTSNIWLSDLSRGGASTRLTFGSRVDEHPVWSPDGSRIVFSSNRAGVYNLYEKSVNGGNEERMLFESGENKTATSWSRNGRFLLYTVVHPKTKADIWVLPMDGGKKPFPFLTTDFNERQARFSPDGRWVAYTSDESGQDEVYVRPFSINAAGTAVEAGARWPISGGFGTEPHWRGDGRELFYRSRDKLLAVEIAVQPAFRAGIPQPLAVPVLLDSWDAAADGKRFLGLTRQGGPQPYTVMLNWQAGLRR